MSLSFSSLAPRTAPAAAAAVPTMQVRHCCCLSGLKRGVNIFTFDSTGSPGDAYGGARIMTVKTTVR